MKLHIFLSHPDISLLALKFHEKLCRCSNVWPGTGCYNQYLYENLALNYVCVNSIVDRLIVLTTINCIYQLHTSYDTGLFPVHQYEQKSSNWKFSKSYYHTWYITHKYDFLARWKHGAFIIFRFCLKTR